MILKKTAGLWRYLRSPVLLTSVTVLALGCASKNPLIDEADSASSETEVTAEVSTDISTRDTQQQNTDITSPVRSKSGGRQTVQIPRQQQTTTPTPQRTERAKPVKRTADKSAKEKEAKAAEAENGLNSEELTGMKKWLNALSAYKRNVQQGNFVSSEMLAKVQPGMTKEQVRFVLGTPLLKDMFHANRWDYLFRLQKPNGAVTTNRVTVFFNENVVDHITNDDLPNETDYLSNISPDEEQSDEIKEAKEKARKRRKEEDKAREKEEAKERKGKKEPEHEQPAPSKRKVEPQVTPEAEAATAPAPVEERKPAAKPQQKETQAPAEQTKPASRTQKQTQPPAAPATTGTTQKAVPAPVTPSTQAPARTPQPSAAQRPATAPKPSYISNQSDIEQARRAHARSRATVQDDADEADSDSENVKTFEPISTPSRARKMRPASPDDKLIGNIQ